MWNKKVPYSFFMLIFVTLACRPVVAISWNEFLIISGLVVVLFGPPLYGWIRRVEEFLKRKEKDN